MQRFRAIFRRWVLLISIAGLLSIIALDIASRYRVIELTWAGEPREEGTDMSASTWFIEVREGLLVFRATDWPTGVRRPRTWRGRPAMDMAPVPVGIGLGLRPERGWIDYSPVSLSERLGFAYYAKPAEMGRFLPPKSAFVFASAPLWSLAAVLAIIPLCTLPGHLRRRRRRRAGQCLRCGYDLRATPDPAGPRLATCPECGLAAN